MGGGEETLLLHCAENEIRFSFSVSDLTFFSSYALLSWMKHSSGVFSSHGVNSLHWRRAGWWRWASAGRAGSAGDRGHRQDSLILWQPRSSLCSGMQRPCSLLVMILRSLYLRLNSKTATHTKAAKNGSSVS